MQQLVTQVFLPLVLAGVMLGIGMGLQAKDFQRLWLQPKAVGLGLVMQWFFLPALALLLIVLLPLEPLAAAGLFLVALCPGGATSNLFALIARGDTALSVTLTAITSLLAPLTLPLFFLAYLHWQPLGLDAFQMPLGASIQQLALVTFMPLLLGMLLRWRWPDWITPRQPGIRRLSTLAMLAIIMALLASHLHLFGRFLSLEGLAILLLSSLAILSGYGLAQKAGLTLPQQRTLGLEVGVQNAGTALLVAFTLLQEPALALLPLMYGLLMNLPAFAFVAWAQHQDRRLAKHLVVEKVREGV